MANSNVVDIFDCDQRIWHARLSGQSVRSIGRQYHLRVAEVEAIIARMATPVNLRMKLRALELDVARLDELFNTYYPKALGGNEHATIICLRILEHRSHLLGLQAPQRIDPVQVSIELTPQTTTERIQAALDEIISMRPQPKSIEAVAQESRSANGDGPMKHPEG